MENIFKDPIRIFPCFIVIGLARTVTSGDEKAYESDGDDTGDLAAVILCLGGSIVILMFVVTAVRRNSSASEADFRCHCRVPCCTFVSREEMYREDKEMTSKATKDDQNHLPQQDNGEFNTNVKTESEKTGYRKKNKGKGQKHNAGPKIKNTRTPTGYWGREKKDEKPVDNDDT